MCGEHFDSDGPQFRRCPACVSKYKTWKQSGLAEEMEDAAVSYSPTIGGYKGRDAENAPTTLGGGGGHNLFNVTGL